MTTRREFLQTAGFSLLTPFVLTTGGHSQRTAAAQPSEAQNSSSVFAWSVASGDPSPTGVVLWTRIHPQAWSAETKLNFEVAKDAEFQRLVMAGEMAAADFASDRDHTVHLDLDGWLAPNHTYYYRFEYGGIMSRTGRCRTCPAAGDSPDSLKLGVVTCQDYTNGYFGAFSHLAQDDVDFVLHLGDFIYETVGDPRFQSLPYPERVPALPSGQTAAMNLEDFRFLYQTHRLDPHFQRLLEAHTLIVLWDDHETANDCYWDYERDTLGAPDHPLVTNHPDGGDPQTLRQLKLAAQRAWAEYVPARVTFHSNAQHPFDALQIYRRFAFGDLADLFATDERTYRTAPPCGLEERVITRGCSQQASPLQTMLGDEQREWFVAGVTQSTALWKIWANEVFLGQLKLGRRDGKKLFINIEAWDGYEAEREAILGALADQGVQNFVALTGDLHTYMASYLKVDYGRRSNLPGANLVGVEFMTPAITSSTLMDFLISMLPAADLVSLQEEETRDPSRFYFENLAKQANPHIHFFNSQEWGYSIVTFTRTDVTYTAYSVPKSPQGAEAPRRLVRKIRVPVNRIVFEDLV